MKTHERRNNMGGKGRCDERGFTLSMMTVSLAAAGILMAGAWSAWSGLQAEWKVAAADRVLDQYGHSALMDLTNRLSWAWGAELLEPGPNNTRVRFWIDDKVDEHRNFDRLFPQLVDEEILVIYDRDKGIKFDNAVPGWNPDRARQYNWWGQRPANSTIKAMDHRDQMTMDGLTFELSEFRNYFNTDPVQAIQRAGVVNVWILMHYRYSPPNTLPLFGQTFAGSYVRERVFQTQIAMRNWDVPNNPWKSLMLEQAMANSGSGS